MWRNAAINRPTCGKSSPSSSGDAPTHCESCGAEYPLPGKDEALGAGGFGTGSPIVPVPDAVLVRPVR
jgi:hypothetical protein